ncbi:MAG: hypothetical protein KKB12_01080, partial [Candidatus Omnitrophica bacterium]|nr:hypothetical protein [Candidatus Omnitrophota bacterium]
MKNKGENIVIFRTDRVGEVLLSTVAVRMIKEHFPESDITFVTSEYSRPLIEGQKDIKKILTADTFSKSRLFFKAIRLADSLRKERFKIAVILNPHKMLHLACFLAGIPNRIGYDRKWGQLLSRSIRDVRADGNKHETEYTMDLLREIGIVGLTPAPRLFVEREAEIIVDDLILQQGLESDKPLIAIHPGSSNPAKQWPEDNYIGLLRKLSREIDCHITVVGHEESREV